jgi:hypothetical protein
MDEKGFWFHMDHDDLTIGCYRGSVFKHQDEWAAKSVPDMELYNGWWVTHVNDVPVISSKEFLEFRKGCPPGTPITFRLRRKLNHSDKGFIWHFFNDEKLNLKLISY